MDRIRSKDQIKNYKEGFINKLRNTSGRGPRFCCNIWFLFLKNGKKPLKKVGRDVKSRILRNLINEQRLKNFNGRLLVKFDLGLSFFHIRCFQKLLNHEVTKAYGRTFVNKSQNFESLGLESRTNGIFTRKRPRKRYGQGKESPKIPDFH